MAKITSNMPVLWIIALMFLIIFLVLFLGTFLRLWNRGIIQRIWNALLPNYLDLWIYVNLGPLYFVFVGIATCGDDPNYGPNPKKEYLPQFTIIEIRWHHADKSHFANQRALLGYELQERQEGRFNGKKKEVASTEYWHIISVLFMDFYFPAKGPLKLRIEP